MTASDAAAETQRQNPELRKILESPLDESASIHMTVKEMRIEVERNGGRRKRSTRATKKKG